MAMQPINYLGLTPQIDLGESLAQGLMLGENIQASRDRRALIKEKVEAARAARERDALFANEFGQWIENPTAQGYAKLLAIDPSKLDALKAGYTQMDAERKAAEIRENSLVKGMADNNDTQGLIDHFRKKVADNPDDADDRETLAYLESGGPQAIKRIGGFATAQLIALAGVDKVAEAYPAFAQEARATELHPDLVRKGKAEADEAGVKAKFAPQVIQTDLQDKQSQIQYRSDQAKIGYGRLAIDRDRLQFDINKAVEELRAKGAEIDPGSMKTMNEAVAASQEGRAMADQAHDLADRFEASSARGNAFSGLGEWAANAAGYQDAVTDLRREYNRLRSSAIIKSLPPGSASDSDIKTAMEGFPPPTADKAHMVRFLRGMAKLQEVKANADAAQADWISENGNLGKAKRDLLVNGARVEAGTSFAEFSKSGAAIRRGGEQSPTLNALDEKYR